VRSTVAETIHPTDPRLSFSENEDVVFTDTCSLPFLMSAGEQLTF